ncbi:MAG: Fic family protein [Pseudomonadales bacterium]
MRYLWNLEEWPKLKWDTERLTPLLARVAHEQGRLLGRMEGLGFDLHKEAQLRALTADVLKSSEIEGEQLPPDQVRSSIARRLGLDISGLVPADREVEGVVEMMTDATVHYADPLTDERLFAWHAALFPTGRSGMSRIAVGRWRDGPMAVVAGPIGKEEVLYEAPPAQRLSDEMKAFLAWFEDTGTMDPLLAAGLAHFWFVTIHPFDDGNGRIARAIADMTLARAEDNAKRFYSMSAQIRAERNDYYTILERTQKSGPDITPWMEWFLTCLHRAIRSAEDIVGTVLQRGRFWQHFAAETLNARQIKGLNRLLDGNFEGKLTSSKWARLNNCSQDTAYRDITDLVERGALQKDPGGGRSTSYSLVLEG